MRRIEECEEGQKAGCGRLHAVDLVNVCPTTMLEIIYYGAMVWAAVLLCCCAVSNEEHTRKNNKTKKKRSIKIL